MVNKLQGVWQVVNKLQKTAIARSTRAHRLPPETFCSVGSDIALRPICLQDFELLYELMKPFTRHVVAMTWQRRIASQLGALQMEWQAL